MSSSPTDLPSGTSLVPGGLETKYGAVFVAIIISAFLMGILTVQIAYYYKNFKNDPLTLKIVVAAIWLLDMGQFGSVVDFVWWYLVTNWGNLNELGNIRHSFGSLVVFEVIIIALVELTFFRRIIVLTPNLWYIHIPIGLLIVTQFVFGLVASKGGLASHTFAEAVEGKFSTALVIVWLGSSVASDVGLATMLCLFLKRHRTGFTGTDSIIDAITFYSMNTCALTSLVSIGDLVAFFTMRENFIHLVFNILICKFFSNSLLVSLNSRSYLREQDSRNHSSAPVEISVRSQRHQQVANADGSVYQLGDLRSQERREKTSHIEFNRPSWSKNADETETNFDSGYGTVSCGTTNPV